ncbi:MAG: oligosaccharide flippase family protein [Tenericutes bacterium]|jgi:stage V sporulation protein B|nr:oligosaccharide flippase family protein [Mycoplasmatota bacterium]
MTKEKFISSAIILIIGGAFTKLLGIISRMVMTRLVGTTGMGLYMLILPTFSLFMAIASLGFPIAISKLVAEDKYNNKKLISSIIPLTILLNLLLMLILFLTAPFLANNLLNDSRCYYPLLSIGLVLPFVSLSSILNGYFYGKQKMIPHVTSNIFEQIIRIILMIFITPFLLEKGIYFAVAGLVLVNIVSELLQIVILLFFLPKNFKITKQDIKPNPHYVKNILHISLPTVTDRIIGLIGYFFEPIILTTILLIAGYSNNYIVNEYGIIQGYVMPLLLMPSFFTNAISSALLPVISKASVSKNIHKKKYIKKKLKQAILISLAIGVPVTIILMIFPNFFLKFIYNTNQGTNYIRFLAPFFLLYYIEAPLSVVLQGINKAKIIMYHTIWAISSKLIILTIFSYLTGIVGLLLSIIASITVTTFCHLYSIKKYL